VSAAAALADDHALLVDAVRAAGALALDFRRRGFDVRHKKPGDPVTDADLAVDRALAERLCAARPGYGWLSEESPESADRAHAPRTWIVDPIDGTKGFVADNDEWAVSVALVEGTRPVAAVVFNPATGELFDAAVGGGARLNGRPIRVTRAVALNGARLGSSRNEQRRRLWMHLVPDARIEVLDAIAHKLALVAAGRLDGVISLRPKSEWDIAAGHLLITEAGGVITEAGGAALAYNKPEPRIAGLIASGPVIYPALRAALARR
jgi:myo-inositol-1(or 4)-monophosphatase